MNKWDLNRKNSLVFSCVFFKKIIARILKDISKIRECYLMVQLRKFNKLQQIS